MDRWKSRFEKSQRRERKKKEDQRRERGRRQKIQVREKVKQSRDTVFSPMFCGSGGSKSRLAKVKRRVRSHLARWEMKNCTPSWREADLEVKKLKTPHAWSIFGQLRCGKSAQRCGAKCEALFVVKMQKKTHVRTTFGSWDVEKVHVVVARSTFWSQHVEKRGSVGVLLEEWRKKCTLLWHEAYLEVKCLITTRSDRFWKLRCRKSARCCGRKHILKSNMLKTRQCWSTFGRRVLQQVHAVGTKQVLKLKY